jgi:tetratricopeptide (TPR) repeat protein
LEGGQVLSSLLLALAVSAADSPAAAGANAAQAHALSLQSIREYNAADFDDALRDAKKAYELSGLPALLFNLGQCHRMLGHWKEAEFFYRGYLREKPEASNRKEVLDLLELVEGKEKSEAAQAATPAPASPPPAEAATPPPAPTVIQVPVVEAGPVPAAAVEAPSRRGLPATTWWLGGSGAALALGGGVLGGLARANGNTDNGINHGVTGPSYVTGQYEGLTADILWSVGGALVVAAVIVAFTSH